MRFGKLTRILNVRAYEGDALTVLKRLPDASVQCCVTSPPYWGLRDYQTARWEGGDRRCDHNQSRRGHSAAKQQSNAGTSRDSFAGICICRKCGARRVDQQLGLERTPDEYVIRIVDIFREVRRVLRDDGTLWLNLGDCYATGAGKACSPGGGAQGANWHGPNGYRGNHAASPKHRQVPDSKNPNAGIPAFQPNRMPQSGLKPKDLCMIPARVALALQADGWYLRSDIIWHKPNPMPESVRDRPTKSHEYLFLLSKSQRYFYNADAIAEPCIDEEYRTEGKVRPNADALYRSDQFGGDNRSGLHIQVGGRETRNRRTVWTVTPRPFKGAHFATFPPKLIEPCILAGSRPGDVVLDPFAGALTTALVCQQHGRKSVMIELNPQYIAMGAARLRDEKNNRTKAVAA